MTDQFDPAEPFRQFLEQFQAGDVRPDGPLTGVPLVPLPGLGDGTTSPERTTKVAVRNLYDVLEVAATSDTSASFWQHYLDALGVDAGFSPSQFGSTILATYRVWFVSLAQLLVESYTVRLLHDELVTDEHRHTAATQEWLWRLPQSDREALLLYTLDVDEDLVADMEATRTLRDELLYSVGTWTETDPLDSVDDVRRYVRVLDRLDARVTGGDGFSFRPTASGDDADSDTGANE